MRVQPWRDLLSRGGPRSFGARFPEQSAAILRALTMRLESGSGSIVNGSLARTGALLMQTLHTDLINQPVIQPIEAADWSENLENTQWGAATRLKWPTTVPGLRMEWEVGAGALGRHPASWND